MPAGLRQVYAGDASLFWEDLGSDARGQVAILVLRLAGVPAEVIAADYALSFERLPARYAAREEEDQGPLLRSFVSERDTTAEAVIVDLLSTFDVEAYLRSAGVTERQLTQLRDRLIETR